MPVQNGSGIGRFFRNLAMGPAMRAGAERKGRLAGYEEMLAEAQVYDHREKAKRGHAENQGLSDLEATLTPLLGVEMAKAAQAAARGKYNLGEATGASADIQHQLFERQARDRILAGDYEGANAYLAGIEGKPLQITDVQEGVVVNPFADRAGQGQQTTSVGSSMIRENDASAAASYASAEASRARAADIRNGGSGEGGGKPLNLDAGLISSMFKTPQMDARGRPITNPLTGEVSTAPDQKQIGQLMSYIAERRRTAPRMSADEITMEYLSRGRRQAATNEADFNDALTAVNSGRISLQEAQRRLRAAGMPNLAAELARQASPSQP